MERNEISMHEARVYYCLMSASDWLTASEVSFRAGVASRTARAHCLKLVRLGLLDQAEVFPAHRYRFSEKARKRNVSYVQRLEQACEIFGIAKE